MPARNADLHGSVPDTSAVALLLVDVINDLEFEGGERLLEPALRAARAIAQLKARARAAGIPVIYANDNEGRWRSDFKATVAHCLQDGVRGRPLVELLMPAPEDYFVLKAKHSAFFATSLDLLLDYLKARTLVLAGFAGHLCVFFTAIDAFMRDFNVIVPRDCTASDDPEKHTLALRMMEELIRVDTRPSAELDLAQLNGRAGQP